MSGNEVDAEGRPLPGDALQVKRIAGIEQAVASMCPYVYENAVSPHLAARLEGNPVEPQIVVAGYNALADYDYITVEGSGGIICPLRVDDEKEYYLEDVVRDLDLPVLIVADAGLGTINAVVLTAEYLRSRNLRAAGIIFNHFHAGDTMEEDNLKMCEQLTGLPILCRVAPDADNLDISAAELAALYE